jgi:hypothetical protein
MSDSILTEKYDTTLFLKSDNDLYEHLEGKKEEYLSKYEHVGYKFLLTKDSLSTEGVIVISIAKYDDELLKYKLLTVQDVMDNYKDFISHLTNFIKKYINTNPRFKYFFTWMPPTTLNLNHEYFLDLSDVFFIEIQTNFAGLYCTPIDPTFRGSQFKKTIYDDPNTRFDEINDDNPDTHLHVAIQTKQLRPDIYTNVCDQYFLDNKNSKITTIVTIDNRDKLYNDDKYCHISSLLEKDLNKSISFFTVLLREFFNRLVVDFKNVPSTNTSNYGLMFFARGMQVPIVHYKIRHSNEYAILRAASYNNIKNTVGKLKILLTETKFKGGNKTKKCPKIKFNYDLLLNFYDSTLPDDTEYEYLMKLKKLLLELRSYGLIFDHAIKILHLASNYILDSVSLKKILNVETEKLVDIIKICENIFTPKIPYMTDYVFYLKLKELIKDEKINDIFVQVKNALRASKINNESFYFINIYISDEDKDQIIKEGNRIYYSRDYSNINNKIQFSYVEEDLKKPIELFYNLDTHDNIDLYTHTNILLYVFDKNNDTLIDEDEFIKYLKSIEDLIDKINTLLPVNRKIDLNIPEQKRKFTRFDANNDKKLNMSEFYNFIKNDLYNRENSESGSIESNFRRNIRHYEFTNISKKISIGAGPLLINDLYMFFTWIKKIILLDNIRYYININEPITDKVNDIEKHIFEKVAESMLEVGSFQYLNFGTPDYTIHKPDNIERFLKLLKGPKSGNILMHCGAGDGRSGFFLFSLLVYKNPFDSYIILLQKFFCSYRFLSFREIFGETHKIKLLIGRLLSLYAVLTKLLNLDTGTLEKRPSFLKLNSEFEPYLINYITVTNENNYNDAWNPELPFDKIFDEESFKVIKKINDLIHLNNKNEDYFKDKKNWDKILDTSIMRDEFEMFVNPEYVDAKNNYNIINTDYYTDINLGINDYENEESNEWLFRKSINNIFTRFFINNIDINLILELIKNIYTDCSKYFKIYIDNNDDLSDNDLYIYIKGGFLFYLIQNKFSSSFEEFEKSDIDFDIYLNPDLVKYNEHFLNVNKIIFNTLYNSLNDYSDLIKNIKFYDYSSRDLSKLYNIINEHIRLYDKSKLKRSSVFRDGNYKLESIQFNNFTYKDSNKIVTKINTNKSTIETFIIDNIYNNIKIYWDRMKINRKKDDKKLLKMSISDDDNHVFVTENMQNVIYSNIVLEGSPVSSLSNMNSYFKFSNFQILKKIKLLNRKNIFNTVKFTFNSSHYYKKDGTDGVSSFNLFRYTIPNYLIFKTGYGLLQPVSFFNELIDIALPKKNDYSLELYNQSNISEYTINIKGKDFIFKGKNIQGLLVDLVSQFKQINYGKKIKRSKRFNNMLILYIDTLEINKKQKKKLYIYIYNILKNGNIKYFDIHISDLIQYIKKEFKLLYDNKELHNEIIKYLLDSFIEHIFRSKPVDKSIYLNIETYKKYMKYKLKYLKLAEKLNI